jgi:spermidine/putrescine transport system ATP-binding protein
VKAPAVSLVGVSKSFGDLVAVEHLDLDIQQGEFFSIIGPSGCGKTTTLRMIAGFEDPTGGTIHVGGLDVTNVRPYRRAVNTVFQSYALFPHLDVYENVAFGLREARRPRAEIDQRVAEAIKLVQLDGRQRARPRQLSGGQQQRVALARALVNRPEVLLLDEPLGALDLKLRAELQTQLKDLHRAVGVTFCYVTHDQGEAFSMSDRVAVMNAGVLEQVGPPEEVYRRPRTAFVADFVGAANRLPGRVSRAEPDGRYLVAMEGIGERVVRGPDTLTAGAEVIVVVRPEELHLDAARPPGATSLPATVVDVAFLGAHRTVRLESAAFGRLVATTGVDGPHRRGDETVVGWSDDSAWAVPVDSRGAVPQRFG